jgi:predicted nucleotidyltransferase
LTIFACQSQIVNRKSTIEMTPATEQKRAQFKQFIKQVVEVETAVKAIVGIGSIATGRMRPDSDIDAIVFLDPPNPHVLPAEGIWDPASDTFHSIFVEDKRLHEEGLPVDFYRVDWQEWTSAKFEWPEERKAELRNGWLAYDATGRMEHIIATRTAYNYDARLKRLDEAIVFIDNHLHWNPEGKWETLGALTANDRMQAAYHYLVDALFAYNQAWRPWRNREMDALLRLPWLPENFEERALSAANPPSLDYAGYVARIEMLRSLFQDVLQQLIANGDYSHVPIDQAFIRSHEEPGRAWNMDEWNRFREVRKMSRGA